MKNEHLSRVDGGMSLTFRWIYRDTSSIGTTATLGFERPIRLRSVNRVTTVTELWRETSRIISQIACNHLVSTYNSCIPLLPEPHSSCILRLKHKLAMGSLTHASKLDKDQLTTPIIHTPLRTPIIHAPLFTFIVHASFSTVVVHTTVDLIVRTTIARVVVHAA